ncbi:MAG: copper chaperone CopZ [Peptococcaceae bacterium]|nr:copper chaperone CopZ [Peptococcaceae bacterium]
MEKTVLNVEGMSCNHCVNSIQKAVGALEGVSKVDVDLAGKTVSVEYEKEKITVETIKETIDDQGYEVK